MDLPVYSAQESHSFIGNLTTDACLYGFHETGHYLIEAPVPGAQMYADDAALKLDDTGEYWHWQPGFFAGEVQLELELAGKAQVRRYVVDVSPAGHKTGREQYTEYLHQIVDYAPSLVAGTEPAKHGLGGRSGSAISLWLRYARLQQFIERYISGVLSIIQRPIIRLSNHRELVPLTMAKRVDNITVQRLRDNPRLLTALGGAGLANDHTPYRGDLIDVPFHEPTLDNPANRLIARQLGEVQRLLRGLIADLTSYRERSSETKTEMVNRLPRRISKLQALNKQLIQLQRCEPFISADKSKQGAAALNAISGNPHYNMTHRFGVRILRLGLSDLADDEQHYLAPTWEIYEAWSFVAIAKALKEQLPEFDWKHMSNPKSADLIIEGRHGDRTVKLYYQMVCYSLESANQHGYCSITRERRPDLILEIKDQNNSRFICLDSKYTASRSTILNSMGSAHIYRDSLRRDSLRPDLSVILVPAIADAGALATENYYQRHGVGCFQLSNNADASSIVLRLLSSAALI